MSETEIPLGMIHSCLGVRSAAADAMVRVLGGTQITLRIADPSTGDTNSQLGLTPPTSEDVPISPALVRTIAPAANGSKRIEVTLSAKARETDRRPVRRHRHSNLAAHGAKACFSAASSCTLTPSSATISAGWTTSTTSWRRSSEIMQPAKDSFYVELRDRLVAVDPQRTITSTGPPGRPSWWPRTSRRPPLLRCATPSICIGAARVRCSHPAERMMEMDCTISYCTKGTEQNGRLDRGRDLASLDNDVLAICSPRAHREVRLQHGLGRGSGIHHLLDAAGVQRAGQRRRRIWAARSHHACSFIPR